jgi:malonate-semialdehyde dehydrogenase (acetylating)/methylmalonate-semialdehyde dehydrogenase
LLLGPLSPWDVVAAEGSAFGTNRASTELGPLINAGHRGFVLDWIEKGIKEGARLVLDGRNLQVPKACEKGFFLGPTIFNHVTEDMEVGREEIFGPVLCFKRVDN